MIKILVLLILEGKDYWFADETQVERSFLTGKIIERFIVYETAEEFANGVEK